MFIASQPPRKLNETDNGANHIAFSPLSTTHNFGFLNKSKNPLIKFQK